MRGNQVFVQDFGSTNGTFVNEAPVSGECELKDGDIVATGTPSGVGPLTAGDVVEIEVVGVSKVSNPVEARA